MKKKIIYLIICFIIIVILSIITIIKTNKESESYIIDLTNLTYNDSKIKVYTQDDFDTFYSNYQNKKLEDVYITEFIFDGVSMYRSYDLDDFVGEGNNYEPEVLKITALNINKTGDIEITGSLKGMILVNTNGIKKDINLLLDNVYIEADKKAPAIYVYNKDINYTNHKVTIKTLSNTSNYISGGKLKKISLMPGDELSSYMDKYSNKYSNYTNYYGIYKSSEIDNILFAKVKADDEDLKDGDPYYFYKAAGAISSDIDLYFEGTGYLNVASKKDEGIETKGNLTFSGGVGTYDIRSLDDGLNTTTASGRNDLTIDVERLTAIVLDDAKEGDAIDSNGTLTINGGTIIALAKPGSDAGLDSSKGTYINGGTVLATGDMADEVSSSSKQKFIYLSFNNAIEKDTLIALVSDSLEFAYKTPRNYTKLIYSSSKIENKEYSLYSGGTIDGKSSDGLYLEGTYTKGILLGYTNNQIGMGMQPIDQPRMDFGGRPNNDVSNSLQSSFEVTGISNIFNGITTYKER